MGKDIDFSILNISIKKIHFKPRFLELDDKMYYVTYKEFKELILNFLTNSELEDMEFIINHCIEGANNE